MVERICEVDVSGRIHLHSRRTVDHSTGADRAISGITCGAVPCNSCDDSCCRRDLPNAMIQPVGDVKVSVGVRLYVPGYKTATGCGAAVAIGERSIWQDRLQRA